tara:strand:+ start:338 stop:1375 length:1038 start_codon:yes stop_codon:yes gene_type:complete
MADMDPEARLQMQQRQNQQQKLQAGIQGIAGVADFFGGRRAQMDSEQDIETLGAQSDEIRQKMEDLKMPSTTSPEAVAAAVRNATILGARGQQDDSSELAAAKMAMESGADPTNVQRALSEAQQRQDESQRANEQGLFQQGLGMQQMDAQRQYEKEMQGLGMDYDDAQMQLQAAQQQSLMGQQQQQKGMAGGLGALVQGVSSYNRGQTLEEQLKAIEDAKKQITPLTPIQASQVSTSTSGGNTGGLVQAQGGRNIVQKTPGAFNHDDGDGVYEEGENELILMQQTAGGLVDTGIRQTGGEFVLNPEQAQALETAYDKIKGKKNPSKQDLMLLFEAARFLDEPQFD